MIDGTAFVHPLALVDRTATLGPACRVWQFSSVIRGARLGAGCNVASNVTLDGPHAGDRCIFSPGVDIGPGFRIGDDVFLGPNVVLCNDVWPETAKDGFDPEFYETNPAVVIGDGASIGANAVVLPGVTIGAGAVVGAGAVAERDVPDNTLLTRDNRLVPVPADRRARRMRAAGSRTVRLLDVALAEGVSGC